MQTSEAPILFINFNRVESTRVVWDTIKKWKPKKLYVSSDGPRKNKYDDDWASIQGNRSLINEIDWDCQLQTRFLENNLGIIME